MRRQLIPQAAKGSRLRLGGLLAPSALAPIIAVSFTSAIGMFAVLMLIAAAAVAAIGVETRQTALQ